METTCNVHGYIVTVVHNKHVDSSQHNELQCKQ